MGCYFRWGDTLTAEGGHFTLTPGIDPSIATIPLQIPTGTTIPTEATLYFSDGANVFIFPDCRAIEGSLSHDTSYRIWTLSVRDRRWKWRKTGDISGEYNRRDEAGNIIDVENQKTAKGLAELCLQAMGEVNYDAGGLSEVNYPYVNWDHENPAEALADLCYRYSAIITLGTNNRVYIYTKGDGAPIPENLPRESHFPHVALVDKPQYVAFVGGKNLIQTEIELVPVGLETTGVLDDLSDMSYAPSDGNWSSVINDETLTSEQRHAIKTSVFKYYGLPSTINIGGVNYTRAEAMRRWHEELVDKSVQDGEYKRDTAYITGVHKTESYLSDPLSSASTATDRVNIPFKFYQKLGLVVFDEKVFDESESKMIGATLTLTCCFEGDTYYWELPQSGLADRKEHVRREDVFYEYKYDSATESFVLQNQLDADSRAEAYAVEAMQKYDYFTEGDVQKTETNVYGGFHHYFPDGGIQQVTWEISSTGNNPPLTTISWGVSHDIPAGTPEHTIYMNNLVKQIRAWREKAYADAKDANNYKAT